MENELITVIVPCFNAGDMIERSISSLCRQTYHNLEIIIIDDGSTDHSSEVIHHLRSLDDRIRSIHQGNHGVSYTRNLGIKEACGKYIVFVDADDFVETDYIQKLYGTIKADHVQLSLCKYTIENNAPDKKKTTGTSFRKDQLLREMFVPRFGIAAFVWNRMYITDTIRDNNLKFDEEISACEDTLFNYQYLNVIDGFRICDEFLYHYSINSSSTMFGSVFNPGKLTANRAFEKMLNMSSDDISKEYIQIAATWYNLILKRQVFHAKAGIDREDLEQINKMLKLNPKAFLSADIPFKYKLAYPFWSLR